MKNKIIPSIINASAMFIVFCIVCILLFGNSFGWFSQNNKVDATGMSVNAYAKMISVEYATSKDGVSYSDYETTSGELPIAKDIKAPGDFIYFRLRIKNTSGKSFDLDSVGFEAPNSTTEVPITKGDNNYYLGTQLQITVIDINGTSLESPSPVDLLNSDFNGSNGNELIFYNSSINLGTSSDDYFIISLKLEFKETGEVQDDYKNFGKTSGVCKRILKIEFSD